MSKSAGFRTDGAPRRIIEVASGDQFVQAMNDRPDVGKIEVVIQVRDAPEDTWIDIASVWTGEWDRHRKPPIPSRQDLVAVARKSNTRFARTVIRSVV